MIIIFGNVPVLSIQNETEEYVSLPSYFCYRDINGVDYTTSIRDQSPAPTCEAYALVASIETKMQYDAQRIFNPDLSECHLYFYAGGTYEAGYVNLIDAANYLIDIGVPDEGCYPDPHRPFDYPFESLAGWENRTVKITEWGWVNHDVDSIKNALIEYGPLILCYYFWRDFNFYKGGVYEHKWGRIVGGHVVSIVGYDDNYQCWIVKNSWGNRWGENGWFRLSYHADVIADWYGFGTGIMYIDGVYGNFEPDVPKVQIDKPNNYKTYLFGFEIHTIFKRLMFQKGAARIFGELTIEVNTENTNKVEFYIDDVKQFEDLDEPFSWYLQTTRGLHTLKIKAYNDYNSSIDIIDFYKFI
jgi:hypothetical protein